MPQCLEHRWACERRLERLTSREGHLDLRDCVGLRRRRESRAQRRLAVWHQPRLRFSASKVAMRHLLLGRPVATKPIPARLRFWELQLAPQEVLDRLRPELREVFHIR